MRPSLADLRRARRSAQGRRADDARRADPEAPARRPARRSPPSCRSATQRGRARRPRPRRSSPALLPGRALGVRVSTSAPASPRAPTCAARSLRDGDRRRGRHDHRRPRSRARSSRARSRRARACACAIAGTRRSPAWRPGSRCRSPPAASSTACSTSATRRAPTRAAADEPAAIPLASHLAVALRTIRLQDDALGLRDYQARLLESANALILGIDRAWRITVCNRALLELTGFHARRGARPRRARLHLRAISAST